MPGLDPSLIADLPSFSGLERRELETLLGYAQPLRYSEGATVFAQGDEAESFYVLLDGHIRVVRSTPEGQQVIVRYISVGELFGIAAALGRSTYPASAVAAAECVALAWPNAKWDELTARFPSLGANTYKTVGGRLQDAHTRVVEMSTEQVEQRVAHALLRLVKQTGRKTAEGVEIDFPITRQDIAEMTGATLHTVSRVLQAWEKDGIVRGGRKRVVVISPHRLLLKAEARKES
ncbi:Crp/Fnr family transcriptional regulator [Nitratireductor aquimarinus]|uniref:Crp/Fnr family transcriptional regulator n=1 Tax=Alphaproteobacteria TaxID=28211 RepID=UPI0019D36F07|nr:MULTISPECIES: Crp/Fnr family transcriptional regulator [Alphaproteobacteria]MBY6020485.1 Crp/Fnr family transcriptional regulator [Nitratireductor sp. DP7N14-4]MBN7755699.1 Crp/Fnr family transcriptional regulator [Nitratireductor aquimarinus]MBN7776065.1 Crp/Fnr family transcriptional regulator [Nitratireductor pacificus]MBN7780729.1 Crp/Fnr family transcriptional regulator [Nitratireductor pacificus]MBN7789535.1 Crp/Fnr family transcriptional regulator [Nitratireductor aquimarinus]